MNLKDKTYVLPTDGLIDTLACLFRHGLCLDMIDISGLRESPKISDDDKYLYEVADHALERVDLDDLFENAAKLGIPDKYPAFYEFLSGLQIENDGMEGPELEAGEEEEDEEEEEIELPEEEESPGGKALHEIVNGKHTGDQRDSEKWVAKDKYRQKLTDEYNAKMISGGEEGRHVIEGRGEKPGISKPLGTGIGGGRAAATGAKAGVTEEAAPEVEKKMGTPEINLEHVKVKSTAVDVTTEMHTGEKNANDVSHVVKGKDYTRLGLKEDDDEEVDPEDRGSNTILSRAGKGKKGKDVKHPMKPSRLAGAAGAAGLKAGADKVAGAVPSTGATRGMTSTPEQAHRAGYRPDSYSSYEKGWDKFRTEAEARRAQGIKDSNAGGKAQATGGKGTTGSRGGTSDVTSSMHKGDKNASNVTNVVKGNNSGKLGTQAKKDAEPDAKQGTVSRNAIYQARKANGGKPVTAEDIAAGKEIPQEAGTAEPGRKGEADRQIGAKDKQPRPGEWEIRNNSDTWVPDREDSGYVIDSYARTGQGVIDPEDMQKKTLENIMRPDGDKGKAKGKKDLQVVTGKKTGAVISGGKERDTVRGDDKIFTGKGSREEQVSGGSGRERFVTGKADELAKNAAEKEKKSQQTMRPPLSMPKKKPDKPKIPTPAAEAAPKPKEAPVEKREIPAGKSSAANWVPEQEASEIPGYVPDTYSGGGHGVIDPDSYQKKALERIMRPEAEKKNGPNSLHVATGKKGGTVIGSGKDRETVRGGENLISKGDDVPAEKTGRERLIMGKADAMATKATEEKHTVQPQMRPPVNGAKKKPKTQVPEAGTSAETKNHEERIGAEKRAEKGAERRAEYRTAPNRPESKATETARQEAKGEGKGEGTSETNRVPEQRATGYVPDSYSKADDSVIRPEDYQAKALDKIMRPDAEKKKESSSVEIVTGDRSKGIIGADQKRDTVRGGDNVVSGATKTTETVGAGIGAERLIKGKPDATKTAPEPKPGFRTPPAPKGRKEDPKTDLIRKGRERSEAMKAAVTAGKVAAAMAAATAGAEKTGDTVKADAGSRNDIPDRISYARKLSFEESFPMWEEAREKAGSLSQKPEKEPETTDLGIKAERDGNRITFNMQGREMTAAVSADNTVNINGSVMNVYGDSGSVFVGFKDLKATGDLIFASNGQIFRRNFDGTFFAEGSPETALIEGKRDHSGELIKGVDRVDFVAPGRRTGDRITVKINGQVRTFTVRADGTIYFNGVTANVYNEEGNGKIWIGWKGLEVRNGEAETPDGMKFHVSDDGHVEHDTGLELETQHNLEAKKETSSGIQMSVPLRFRNDEMPEFDQKGNVFTAKDIASKLAKVSVFRRFGGGTEEQAWAAAPAGSGSGQSWVPDTSVPAPAPTEGGELKEGDPIRDSGEVSGKGAHKTRDPLKRKENPGGPVNPGDGGTGGPPDNQGGGSNPPGDPNPETKKDPEPEKWRRRKFDGKEVGLILRGGKITKTLDKQGRAMHTMMSNDSIRDMYSVKLSEENIQSIADNYDHILAVNCRSASEFAKMNTLLEGRYLDEQYKKELEDARKGLKKAGLTENSTKLKELLEKGGLTTEQQLAAEEYIRAYEKSRKKIIKDGILVYSDKNKNSRIEHTFFAASMIVLMQENGLPTDEKTIRKMLNQGKLTEEQAKIARNALKTNRAFELYGAAEKGLHATARTSVNTVKGTYRTAKSRAQKHMGNDYTTRGALMAAGVIVGAISSPFKAVKLVKKTRKVVKNTAKVANTVSRASGKAAKAGYNAAKTTAKVAKKIAKQPIKQTKKEAKKAVKKATVKAAKVTAQATAKATIQLAKVILHLLTTIISAIVAFLGPAIAIALFVLILVFGIFSFITNSGDTIYYDAGDEDTSQVIQEMVDVLTLCHNSFRENLTNQFRGSMGIVGNSNGSGVYMIGDSITVQSQNKIKELMPEITINAQSSIWFSKNETEEDGEVLVSGTNRIPDMGNPAVLVFALGTNGGVSQTDISNLLAALGGRDIKIILMTIYYRDNFARSQMESTNAVVKQAAEEHDNITIFDWYTIASADPTTLIRGGNDKTHPTEAGTQKFAEGVKEAVDAVVLSSSATGATGTAGGGPQLHKGESSEVYGKYNVTSGSWWNYEFAFDAFTYGTGTDSRKLQDMIKSGKISKSNNGGYLFLNNSMYAAAFTLYWGNVGDVLKVEFDKPFKIGDQPESNIMYILIVDIKNYEHTGYPADPNGLYGHINGGTYRDFAEFTGYDGVSSSETGSMNMNTWGVTPMRATNMGNIMDESCDLSTVTGGVTSVSTSGAELYYYQYIDQKVYRDIIDRENNIYQMFPEEKEPPTGLVLNKPPVDENGEIYGFYNNDQELISMVLAMFDFDINAATSVKRDSLLMYDKSGIDEAAADAAVERKITNKINDDTWRLITYFDEVGLDLTEYKEGGYDDLRYSTLVGLFNASHIVTWNTVKVHHAKGKAYQTPIMETTTSTFTKPDGTVKTVTDKHFKTDENGDIMYRTDYSPCPGHTSKVAAVITLHFDYLMDLQKWWDEHIYSVDNFEEENPEYSSDDPENPNFNARNSVLKNGFQCIKKPEFNIEEDGACSEEYSSGSAFHNGSMSQSQTEVAKRCYNFIMNEMGLTSEQAIGILVNIMRECDFNYALEEVGSGQGYGLCQWTQGRRTQLIEWCKSHPDKGAYNTLEGQLAFFQYEFDNSTEAWSANSDKANGFRQLETEKDAGEYFLRYYERPAAEFLNQRLAEMESDVEKIKTMLGISESE